MMSQLTVLVDKETLRRFKGLARERNGLDRRWLGYAVEEALSAWVRAEERRREGR